MILIPVILCGFAGWRIASLLVEEQGPFHIFATVRKIVSADGFEVKGFLPELFACIWCLSPYSVAAMWGLWYVSETAVGIIAAMGLALVVEKVARVMRATTPIKRPFPEKGAHPPE